MGAAGVAGSTWMDQVPGPEPATRKSRPTSRPAASSTRRFEPDSSGPAAPGSRACITESIPAAAPPPSARTVATNGCPADGVASAMTPRDRPAQSVTSMRGGPGTAPPAGESGRRAATSARCRRHSADRDASTPRAAVTAPSPAPAPGGIGSPGGGAPPKTSASS